MEELLDLEQARILFSPKKGVVLCVLSEEEREILQKSIGISLSGEKHLSCQHLEFMEQKIAGNPPALICVGVEDEVSAEECGLIYAMLVRCRKVISCRDKLEDMLRHQDESSWEKVKELADKRVMDLFKQTWKQVDSYPYIIVDNIKAYNKGEGYIMKALYKHLSERTPGIKNDGDKAMITLLRQMFEEISLSLIKPNVIILGRNIPEIQIEETQVYRLNLL